MITICLALVYVWQALCWVLKHTCIETYRTYTASFNFHIDLEVSILPIRGLNFKISCLRPLDQKGEKKYKLNIKFGSKQCIYFKYFQHKTDNWSQGGHWGHSASPQRALIGSFPLTPLMHLQGLLTQNCGLQVKLNLYLLCYFYTKPQQSLTARFVRQGG